MKHSIITTLVGLLMFATPMFSQNKTTVRANNSDISDNLDLRAVATIFGEAATLEDFERRLNDPKLQISNLDLNQDNYVDYLRVIESVEGNAHLIIIQAVLDKDLFQDIASVEVERDTNNNIQVQVVGNVYMYGNNYIYEPVYVNQPIIYNTFWVNNYRPYYSSWNWGYYPTYYTYWKPYSIFRYRNNIAIHINFKNSYNYVPTRRLAYAYNNYYGRRANGYEIRYPNRSFSNRNNGYSNRYELDQNRTIRTRVSATRTVAQNNGARANSAVSTRTNSNARYSRATPTNTSRSNTSARVSTSSRYSTSTPRTTTTSSRANTSSTSRNYSSSKINTPSSRSSSLGTRSSSNSSRVAPQTRSTSRQSTTTTSRSSSNTRTSSSRNGNTSRGERG